MSQSGSIVKKGARYFVVTRHTDPVTGKRQQRGHGGYPTKKHAQVALRKVLTDMDNGTFAAPDKITVGAFLVNRWLPTLETSGLKPTTVLGYQLHVTRYIVPALGELPLQKLAPGHLETLYGKLLTDGGAGGAALSPGSVRKTHATLTKSLAAAQRWGLVARNVATVAELPKHTAGRREMHHWDAPEVARFLAHVHGDRLYALWALGFTRGLRRGELLGLRWQDVDLELGRLSIRHTLVQVGYRVVESTPKTTRSRRSIPLDPTVVKALRALQVAQKQERLAWGPAWHDTGLVFTRENGRLIHPDTASQWFEKHAAAAGLRRIRFHDIRHTAATLLLANGAPMKVVSEWLGHASVSITIDLYQHVIPAMEHAASETMAALLFGGEA